MQVKSIADYVRPSLSYHLSLRSLFCLFLSGRLHKVYCTRTALSAKKRFFYVQNTYEYDQEILESQINTQHCREETYIYNTDNKKT